MFFNEITHKKHFYFTNNKNICSEHTPSATLPLIKLFLTLGKNFKFFDVELMKYFSKSKIKTFTLRNNLENLVSFEIILNLFRLNFDKNSVFDGLVSKNSLFKIKYKGLTSSIEKDFVVDKVYSLRIHALNNLFESFYLFTKKFNRNKLTNKSHLISYKYEIKNFKIRRKNYYLNVSD